MMFTKTNQRDVGPSRKVAMVSAPSLDTMLGTAIPLSILLTLNLMVLFISEMVSKIIIFASSCDYNKFQKVDLLYMSQSGNNI